ncbi:MAG: hypothetical protein A2937_03230 [Candidatus Yonathbacteria bacterium RIFCSPLOWO2_01_FULL_47_33b]|uniref:YqgF/RNase H-like domain-containing protein n=1 Tax=Candidatus Yonathbacteria bacterium RIFCSPLOWO2_01_FULL_47_33b TaxID=1802727 RepID=A0A1G2SFY9_9BACT|nr:MAG: hypothetical protein A2937_03230 [Candidatus Yonathbacteria bacterium RIFCSPLOWO2_01_FULL_47_33b]
MRYLGIDYGTKRVGVAVSDEGGTMAFPYAILESDETKFKNPLEIITNAINEYLHLATLQKIDILKNKQIGNR